LLIPLFVIAAMITLPTGAVVGADHNHLLMAGLAICAGPGALVADLLRRLTALSPADALSWASGACVLALIVGYALVTSEPSSWYAPDLTMPSAAQQEQLRKIVQNVRDNPGTLIYADDPGIAALASKTTDYDDPFTMTALAEQGRWDETYFRDSLRSGRFPLLVLSCDVNVPNSCRADTFTPGVLDAIRAGYTVLFRDVLFTYAPREP
jgi:hypothetical protein